jgi:hypothetical protein
MSISSMIRKEQKAQRDEARKRAALKLKRKQEKWTDSVVRSLPGIAHVEEPTNGSPSKPIYIGRFKQ